jgi:hypothetical protein
MFKYKILLLPALLCFCLGISAQTTEWQWVQTAASAGGESGTSIAVDSQGYGYVTGSFSDSLYAGATTLYSSGGSGIFVGKLDDAGNWIWAVQASGADALVVNRIWADSLGNSYICGRYSGAVSFGSHSLPSAAGYNIYVAKLDTSGAWLWATFAGNGAYADAKDIVSDNSGNVYIAGSYVGNAVFGSDIVGNNGSFDLFYAKLDASGSWQWAHHAGGGLSDYAYGIALDSSGNVFIVGSFSDNADFGGTTYTSAGYHDVFVVKYNPLGEVVWFRPGGGLNDDWGHQICLDQDGNVYISGVFRSSAAFGSFILNVIEGFFPEVYVCKLNSEGIWLWAKQAGGYDIISVNGIGVTQDQHVWLTGGFNGQAVFYPNQLTSLGEGDIYLAGLDPDGNWQTPLQAGGSGADNSADLCILGMDIWLCGAFSDNVFFDDTPFASLGGQDVFAGKCIYVSPVEDETDIPSAPFIMEANYPNPFRSSTSIPVQVKHSGLTLELTIYDLRGRKIVTLLQGQLMKGAHSIVWDGRDCNGLAMPAGIYLCKMSGSDHSSIRRIVLIK